MLAKARSVNDKFKGFAPEEKRQLLKGLKQVGGTPGSITSTEKKFIASSKKEINLSLKPVKAAKKDNDMGWAELGDED